VRIHVLTVIKQYFLVLDGIFGLEQDFFLLGNRTAKFSISPMLGWWSNIANGNTA
jgi:hypothetical protein